MRYISDEHQARAFARTAEVHRDLVLTSQAADAYRSARQEVFDVLLPPDLLLTERQREVLAELDTAEEALHQFRAECRVEAARGDASGAPR